MATGAGAIVQHVYALRGPQHVTAVEKAGGVTVVGNAALDIDVDTPPFISAAAISDPAPALGQSVAFNATVADADPGDSITGYAWDFGDGATSAAPAPTHAYVVPGQHTVSLTVTDSRGVSSALFSQTLDVKADTAPSVAVGASKAGPAIGEPVSFFANAVDPDLGDLAGLVFAWDFGDGGTSTAENPTHAYAAAGARTVKLFVTDRWGARGFDSTTVIVPSGRVVGDTPPRGSITSAPKAPRSGQRVTFTAHASDPDGTVAALAWDLDNDGVFGNDKGASKDGKTARVTFSSPGRHTVRLRVTDNRGVSTVASRTIVVDDRPPVPRFTYTPKHPRAGQRVSFVSLSTDPDSPTLRPRWDLDGDGKYDDATGTLVSRVFKTGGRHRVGIRVTDSDGVSRVLHHTIAVAARAYPMLSPFPIVRIVGTVSRRGARVTLLSVTAPRGTRISVACSGRGCPARRSVRKGRGRSVRFGAFEHYLRAGVRLGVRVTRAGRIGKYTTFTIRSGRSPVRKDRCLRPGRRSPVSCP